LIAEFLELKPVRRALKRERDAVERQGPPPSTGATFTFSEVSMMSRTWMPLYAAATT